jgi:hypothetical protein
MTVKTAKVSGRRQLRFDSFEEVRSDVNALVSGKVHTLGNWSLPQILEHLARSMDMAVDGADFKPNWAIRQLGRMMKKRVLKSPMQPGFTLPKIAKGLEPDELPLDKALQHFRSALKRLDAESTRAPHPVFGALTLEESNQLQLRHAELHLSFVAPGEEAEENEPEAAAAKSR